MNKIKIILIGGFILVVAIAMLLNNKDILTIINSNLNHLKIFSNDFPLESSLYFFTISIFLTSFSVPVAFILGILAGIIFDPLKAIILVSFSSSVGATFALIISRYIFRDFLRNRYSSQYQTINNGFIKNGIYYLFAIRMTPIFPYFLANLLSGLTTIKILPYYLTTQIGMLPMTTVIIYLGKGLDQIILSDTKIEAEFLILFSLLGLLPLIFSYIFKKVLN